MTEGTKGNGSLFLACVCRSFDTRGSCKGNRVRESILSKNHPQLGKYPLEGRRGLRRVQEREVESTVSWGKAAFYLRSGIWEQRGLIRPLLGRTLGRQQGPEK